MEERLTELVVIVDKSGSMTGEEIKVIRGYNTLLGTQQQIPGLANITTVLFDEAIKLLYSGDLNNAPYMDAVDYRPTGSTALLDTMYDVISGTIDRLEKTLGYAVDSGVVCALFTDGGDNCSTVSIERVRLLIQSCIKRNWQFIFLSDSKEAIDLAMNVGLSKDSIKSLKTKNLEEAFKQISEKATAFRLEQAKKDEEDRRKRDALQKPEARGLDADQST